MASTDPLDVVDGHSRAGEAGAGGGHHDARHGHGGGPGHGHDHARPSGPLGRLLQAVVGHSHDPGDSLDDALEGDARGIRAVRLSLVGLACTAAIQLVVVLASGSIALFADTVHNGADALTAIPLWIAFSLGSRAANRRYTFGYRRAEDLAGLFVLGMIVLSAAVAGWESLNRLVHPEPVRALAFVAAAGVAGFVGNEAVALYRLRVGREIGSAALVADGYHARTDGLTSLAVVLGALGVAAGYPIADPVVGLLITLAVLVVLRQATAQMLGRLMDAVEPEVVDRVEQTAAGAPEVQSVDRVRVRWLGHALEAYLAITVDCDMTVSEGHRVAEDVRHRLLHEVPRLDLALVHVNPCNHDDRDPHAALRHHDVRG